MSLRPPPKISQRHDWARGEVPLGSTVDQQPEGDVVRQSQEEIAKRRKFFQPTQPIPKPICDGSGQLDKTQDVFVVISETSRSQEIRVKSLRLEGFGIDRCRGLWRLLEPTTWLGPKLVKSVNCKERLKWRAHPEEIEEEDDHSHWRRTDVVSERGGKIQFPCYGSGFSCIQLKN